MAKVTRRQERECAFRVMYSYEANRDEKDPGAYFDRTCESAELEYGDYSKSLFTEAAGKLGDIDGIIKDNLKGWTLKRVSKVSLAILRISVYEIMFSDEVPDAVSINEALEIAKLYDADGAHLFINGVLNSVSSGKSRARHTEDGEKETE